MSTIPPVVLRYYADDEDGRDPAEINSFAAVEVNEKEVDLIVHPYTDEARTFSLPPAEAWKLARELARAATLAEGWEG